MKTSRVSLPLPFWWLPQQKKTLHSRPLPRLTSQSHQRRLLVRKRDLLLLREAGLREVLDESGGTHISSGPTQ
jgi:hypothetical protein